MADVRILLTDKAIAQLPVPDDGWYLARDTELKGFFVVVGKRRRTFTVQGDLRKGGKRASSIRVSIGDTREMSTRTARAAAKEYFAQISRGQHPKRPQNGLSGSSENAENKATSTDVTLRQAWQRYLAAHLLRKGRSEKTIVAIAIMWNASLRNGWTSLCMNLAPTQLAWRKSTTTSRRKMDPISRTGAMRTLRAIYNHARKTNKKFRPIILRTPSIGTRRSAATPAWAWVT